MTSAQATLFNTVPTQDYFNLFKRGGSPDCKKVVDLLEYKKEDVSVATNVAITSIRYDEKMPGELQERIREWAVALNHVAGYFDSQEKAILWFQIPNPLLGGMSPKDMIRVGRFKKLLKFIQTALDENQR